jgi:solute carrier family 25, member 39/40
VRICDNRVGTNYQIIAVAESLTQNVGLVLSGDSLPYSSLFPRRSTPLAMDPFQAKMVAAAVGSTLTALTSTSRTLLLDWRSLTDFIVTPFDVVKTRLQTQPPRQQPLFPRPPPNTCCQPNATTCVRQMSSLAARSTAEELVCVWDHGVFKTERVNGFADAFRHVWRAEGLRGLWKGAGTTL